MFYILYLDRNVIAVFYLMRRLSRKHEMSVGPCFFKIEGCPKVHKF